MAAALSLTALADPSGVPAAGGAGEKRGFSPPRAPVPPNDLPVGRCLAGRLCGRSSKESQGSARLEGARPFLSAAAFELRGSAGGVSIRPSFSVSGERVSLAGKPSH